MNPKEDLGGLKIYPIKSAEKLDLVKIQLGVGYLQWPPEERRSDRYGCVRLFIDNPARGYVRDAELRILDFPSVPESIYGKLIAKVLATQKSSHIGDLIRRIFPKTPRVGEVLELGEGMLFVTRDEHGALVGLKPLEDRGNDWLNPKVLYRLHDQKVNLRFEEVKSPTIKSSTN